MNLVFLGSAFTIMLVYVWSRRNPYVRMNFFGLMNFQAPYLPWVLLGFSLLLGNSIIVDIMGKYMYWVLPYYLVIISLFPLVPPKKISQIFGLWWCFIIQIKKLSVKYFFYPSAQTCVLGAQKNRLNEMVLLSTYNTCIG